jgi:hypothetical protein
MKLPSPRDCELKVKTRFKQDGDKKWQRSKEKPLYIHRCSHADCKHSKGAPVCLALTLQKSDVQMTPFPTMISIIYTLRYLKFVVRDQWNCFISFWRT